MNWTILKLIEWTSEYFIKYNIPNPRLDAELLLSHTLGKKRLDLYLSFDQIVTEKDLAVFKNHIQRRIKREPLQYIIGSQDFCDVQIKVTPDVLIPRPETEILVEEVLKLPITHHISPITILDLCTGSGCIIAALADKLPNANFVGVDISEKALAIARENTEKWSNRIELICGNVFAPLLKHENTKTRKYDLITANPPYVPEAELQNLQSEIRDFEPKEALIAKEDGLAIIHEIINNAYKFLKPGGKLIMEIGNEQAEAVKKMIAETLCYTGTKMIKDYGGIERIVWTSLLSMADAD